MIYKYFTAAAAIAAAYAIIPSSYAAGSGDHSHGGITEAIGKPGGTPSRTVEVVMYDNYYEPENLAVAPGETIKFVVRNSGDFLHEFNIATAEMHVEHQSHMAMMMEMEALLPDRVNHEMMEATRGTDHDMTHDDPNSVLVEPGQTKELVWTFRTELELEFACNIPGHYDAGMSGLIEIAQ